MGIPQYEPLRRLWPCWQVARKPWPFPRGWRRCTLRYWGAGAKQGADIISAGDVYGSTYALQRDLFASLGVKTRFVDVTDLNQVAEALDEERPMALVCETISNPLLKVADVPALALGMR
ncbi:MAG: PLP-dependent transferase [Anaerolineales bacterium]